MIQGYGPVTQALLGTLLTWGLTAAGAAMVIFLRGNQVRELNNNSIDDINILIKLLFVWNFQRKSLDLALGFAAGVMIAASFWSLLAPAIELAESSGTYGRNGEYAFIPVAGGFLLGSIFVFATDKVISYLGINSSHMMIGKTPIYLLNEMTNQRLISIFSRLSIALTSANKDKADIALDDAENAEYQRKLHYSE